MGGGVEVEVKVGCIVGVLGAVDITGGGAEHAIKTKTRANKIIFSIFFFALSGVTNEARNVDEALTRHAMRFDCATLRSARYYFAISAASKAMISSDFITLP